MKISIPSLLRIKPNALAKMGKYVRGQGYSRVVICWGENLQSLYGNLVRESLQKDQVELLVEWELKDNNIENIWQQSLKLPEKTHALIAIGGGKVIDIAKYLAFINNIKCYSVPTAISNDGFGSPLASLIVANKRKTLKVTIPHAVIVDTEVIKNCPEIFLYSGIGDLICKYTALWDWKLAFHQTGEEVSDVAYSISRAAFDAFAWSPVRNIKDHQYIALIANSLLTTGIAMEIAGSSRPASGSEHLISHAYDKLAATPSMHGLQVGIASYAVSLLQQDTYPVMKRLIEETGLLDYMEQRPLDLKTFQEAIRLAPTIKDNFYTVLSRVDAIEKLILLSTTDPILMRVLK